MRPHKTIHSAKVYKLPGGTEENDLWTYEVHDDRNHPVTCSVWVPTDEERERIANGENIRLCTWGRSHPPVALDLTDEMLDTLSTGKMSAG